MFSFGCRYISDLTNILFIAHQSLIIEVSQQEVIIAVVK